MGRRVIYNPGNDEPVELRSSKFWPANTAARQGVREWMSTVVDDLPDPAQLEEALSTAKTWRTDVQARVTSCNRTLNQAKAKSPDGYISPRDYRLNRAAHAAAASELAKWERVLAKLKRWARKLENKRPPAVAVIQGEAQLVRNARGQLSLQLGESTVRPTHDLRNLLKTVFEAGYEMGYGNGFHDGTEAGPDGDPDDHYDASPGGCYEMRAEEDGQEEGWLNRLLQILGGAIA